MRKCWLSRGYGSKSFDSFVLCAVSSLNTKTFGRISRQSRRYSSIPCCFLPRNLVLVFRVFRPGYACNDVVDAQLFLFLSTQETSLKKHQSKWIILKLILWKKTMKMEMPFKSREISSLIILPDT